MGGPRDTGIIVLFINEEELSAALNLNDLNGSIEPELES
jgi:hypothetical protein